MCETQGKVDEKGGARVIVSHNLQSTSLLWNPDLIILGTVNFITQTLFATVC